MKFTRNLPLPSKKNMLLVLTVAAITLLLSSGLSVWLSKTTELEIPSRAIIKTIGVEAYWDENLENKTEEINWDIIWVGTSKNVTLYLRSVSNIETVLKLNTTNWNPTNISNNMNLSWDYNGTLINHGEVIRVTMTLSALPSVHFKEYIISYNIKEFSFDIIIHASE
ncbi:hypothetical protein KA005_59615 [bacterium]|nr:hypothetical protein [bacterium]